MDLYFLYEITLDETDYFLKDTSMIIRESADILEDTDTFDQIIIITGDDKV